MKQSVEFEREKSPRLIVSIKNQKPGASIWRSGAPMIKAQQAEEAKGHMNIKKCLIYFLEKHEIILLCFYFLISTVDISFRQKLKYFTEFLRLYCIKKTNRKYKKSSGKRGAMWKRTW